jgi:hypothetical protein
MLPNCEKVPTILLPTALKGYVFDKPMADVEIDKRLAVYAVHLANNDEATAA